MAKTTTTSMEVQKIREGLWRWTAPHPDWTPEKDKPGGWGQMVGCVYYEPPRLPAERGRSGASSARKVWIAGGSKAKSSSGSAPRREAAGNAAREASGGSARRREATGVAASGSARRREAAGDADRDAARETSGGPLGAVILIDPLAPPAGTRDAARFWSALDRDIERAKLPVAILIGNEYHSRSARVVYDRYRSGPGASIWAHEAAVPSLPIQVTHTFRAGTPLPGGVESESIDSLSDGEVVFYLPAHRALVVADALLSASPGRIQVAPQSWAPGTSEGAARYKRRFRRSLSGLLDRPVSLVLVSHGPPVLRAGRRALAAAIEGPEWGK